MPAQSPISATSDELSDIELVDRLLRGVPGAFDLFYHRHDRLILHCVRARARGSFRADEDDVWDLFQSFFERLAARDYHILKLWQRGTSLPIYLSRVIRNFVIDDFHRPNRSRKKAEDSLSAHALIDAPRVDKETNPGVKFGAPIKGEEITPAIELRELRRLGIQAWAELDPRDKFLTCGKLHRELSNEAMAERLKLTEGALRTALSRAQGRLLASLKMRAPEYFPT